jgi:hypothetical protein
MAERARASEPDVVADTAIEAAARVVEAVARYDLGAFGADDDLALIPDDGGEWIRREDAAAAVRMLKGSSD